MRDFSTWLFKKGKSERTIDTYIECVNSFISWYENHSSNKFFPNKIKEEDVKDWIKDMRENGWKDSTAKIRLLGVRSFFNFLEQENQVDVNPTRHIWSTPIENRYDKPRCLSPEEENIVTKYVEEADSKNPWKNTRNKSIIYLMLEAGLKSSEVIHLHLSDLDFDEKIINIFREDVQEERGIEMTKNVERSLKDWLIERSKKLGGEENPFVIISQKGGPMTDEGITDYIRKKLRKGTGISDLTAHVLRHTFCNNLVRQGVPPAYASYVAGTSIGQIMLYYPKSSNGKR